MAETLPLKRQREDLPLPQPSGEIETNKRHKSYNQILSLLDEEEEEPNQDFSSFLTSLQQELSTDFPPTAAADLDYAVDITTVDDYTCCSSSSSSTFDFKELEGEDGREGVIRHLLEASDDELGIPTAASGGDDAVVGGLAAAAAEEAEADSLGGFPVCEGLWEFEDVNANYYTMLQSELFM